MHSSSGSRFVLRVDERDNVATVLRELKKAERVLLDDGDTIVLEDSIGFGHKFALRDIKSGEEVIKYGQAIGRACKDIKKGQHVHVHNVESERGRGDRPVR